MNFAEKNTVTRDQNRTEGFFRAFIRNTVFRQQARIADEDGFAIHLSDNALPCQLAHAFRLGNGRHSGEDGFCHGVV